MLFTLCEVLDKVAVPADAAWFGMAFILAAVLIAWLVSLGSPKGAYVPPVLASVPFVWLVIEPIEDVTLRSAILAEYGPAYPRDMRLAATGVLLSMWLLVPLVIRHGSRIGRRMLKADLASLGLCASCRYDLSGLDGSRCPECGAEPRA